MRSAHTRHKCLHAISHRLAKVARRNPPAELCLRPGSITRKIHQCKKCKKSEQFIGWECKQFGLVVSKILVM